jgi:phosphoglucan,water dikinase
MKTPAANRQISTSPDPVAVRIGNQTAISAASIMEPFELALAQGLKAFEWFPDRQVDEQGVRHGWDEDDIDAEQRQAIRRRALEADVSLSVHAPWQANPLTPEGRPLLEHSVDFARDIGAGLVNLHLYMDRGSRAYVEALAPIVAYADAGSGPRVRISIENTPLTGPEDFNRVFSRLADLGLGGDRVGMCLDMGHANLYAGTRNDYIRYLDSLAPELPIIHLHMHENRGDRDSHLTLFTGPSRDDDRGIRALIERLQRRGYRGAMILEQWPRPPELLLEAAQRLQQLLRARPSPPRRPSQGSRQAARSPDPDSDPEPELAAAPDRFAAALIAMHRDTASWRQRLERIRDLARAPDFRADAESLASLAVYLRFLGTGEAACGEDGRHFRPHHHAAAALDIETALGAAAAPDLAWLLRKVYPWLPSYDSAFRRSEPLTRIRDIAHRNDIPKDLKREIKHTLQNKLHRCAGPEDLHTSAGLLQRVTAPDAGCAPEFVAEFRTFHEELSEFFNAASLERRLEGILPLLDAGQAKQVLAFQKLKQAREPGTESIPVALLQALTRLRETIAEQLAAEPRTPPAGIEAEQAEQRLRNADIGLEDYGFALLAETASRVRGLGPDLLAALDSALTGVALGGIRVPECAAIRSELRTWSQQLAGRETETEAGPAERLSLLRIKASLERILRLAGEHTERILALFPPRVEALGRALGVRGHAIRTFVEGDLRGHSLFPLTRLAQTARAETAARLGLPPWSVIVPGGSSGTLRRAADLEDLRAEPGPLLVLLEHAHGEEDIPPHIAGILLAHPIPQLSHLGVRAREAGTPFAAAESAAALDRFRPLEGTRAQLRIDAEGVRLTPATPAPDSLPGRGTVSAGPALERGSRSAPADIGRAGELLPLAEARPENCGAKAAASATLRRLAEQSEGLFGAPDGLILPFGSLELALARNYEAQHAYRELLETALSPEDLERLRRIVLGLALPEGLSESIRRQFGRRPLAVRSSSNGEDLEGLAGAGLYDSVIGIRAEQAEDAVRRVWASLWTARAARSREAAGIPHDRARMGVLIQPLVEPELSFIMHTTDPVRDDSGWALVELAVGLGETLASAARAGTPYRMRAAKREPSVLLEACADFSVALCAPDAGHASGLRERRLDYSRVALSRDPEAAVALGRRLGRIAQRLEEHLGLPQDVEGAVTADGQIVLLQSRPQTGRIGLRAQPTVARRRHPVAAASSPVLEGRAIDPAELESETLELEEIDP